MDRLRQYCEERLPILYQPEEQSWAGLRLHQELKAIHAYGQGQAFEDARASIQLIKNQGGQCRLIGAGCSSLVSYLLGFSEIDPIEHGLPYERFLEASSNRTVQFQFVAHPKTDRFGAEYQPIQDGLSSGAVRIQQATPHEAMPGLIAEEIRRTDYRFELALIPQHDQMVFETLRSGHIEGFSQFQGLDARRLLSDIKRRCLTELAAIKAIMIAEDDEPGTLDEFIRRGDTQNHSESKEWQVQTTLVQTRGMMLFQEQIMLVLNRVADIPMADAYAFVKAVCKRKWEQVATFREWFVVAAVGNGMNEQEALTLFESIRNSATRAVCKAHHLSEALMAYQTAFLKSHFPREFEKALQIIQQ